MNHLIFTATLLISTVTWALTNQPETNYQIQKQENVVGSKETLKVSPCVIRFERFGTDGRNATYCRYKGTYNVLERFEKQSWLMENGRIYPGSFRTDKVIESKLKEEKIDIYDQCTIENAKRLCNSRRIQYTALINSLDAKPETVKEPTDEDAED